MKNLKHNVGFLIPLLIFILISSIILFNIKQGDGLRFFSDNRTPFWNNYFFYGTLLAEEFIYAILTILAFVFVSLRLAIMIPFTGFAVMGISNILKEFFQHKRPLRYYSDRGLMDEFTLVDGVELLGGVSSFPSGHTMSGFALFYLLSTMSKKWAVGIFFFILALTVGLSRVYLFQHFYKDILFGACLGIIVSYLVQFIFSFVNESPKHLINKNLFQILQKQEKQA